MANMTFHEEYGTIPVSLLRKIKKLNVSPADYGAMDDLGLTFKEMAEHLDRHTVNGMYNPPWPMRF